MMAILDGEAYYKSEVTQYTTLELMEAISQKHLDLKAREEAIEISKDQLLEVNPENQEELTLAQERLDVLTQKQEAEELKYKDMLDALDRLSLLNNGHLPN